jgi:hypothetical protein
MGRERIRKCGLCGSKVTAEYRKYEWEGITVEKVYFFGCKYCHHTWLPVSEERRIDRILLKLRNERIMI